MATNMQQQSDFDRLHTNYQEFHDDSDEEEAPPQSYQHGGNAWFPPNAGSPSKRGDGDASHDAPGGGVILHMVPESSKSRWSHIEDLDSFFKKVYEYHQKHGFKVMMLQKFFDLAQVLFVIILTAYLVDCVDYDVLFTNKVQGGVVGQKVHIKDVFSSPGSCAAKFTFSMWIYLLVACSLWMLKALAVCYQVFQYWDIKSFYNQALKISDDQLDSVTWQEVQKRLVEAQSDYLMCIHKEQLTELDIYHRILRFKNYMVAMVNKDLLPVRFNAPCFGTDFLFLSQGLKWNFEFLLFTGPWAPFDKWHLKEDYRKTNKRKELISYLQNKIAVVALLNLLLSPVILIWQILFGFFKYTALVKREPGSLGVRKWSQYGKLYLRHFNEHDHELKVRLNRAYEPANRYMDIFVSPVAAVVARFICFIAGSVLAVLICLTVWDEDVLNVEHLLTIMTLLGAIVAASSLFIPNPNLVFNPEKTLTAVIAHVHYFPDAWKGQAHMPKVMEELGELFPYTAVYLLHEILSPIITPFVLMFSLRPKAGAIVDFFRNFTVDIVGVGDVCSFAQMDVRRHGNAAWQTTGAENDNPSPAKTNIHTQAEDGKTEMSLVNFTLTNPDWKPPQESESFITGLRGCAARDAEALPTLTEEQLDGNPLCSSLHSLNAAGGIYSQIAAGVFNGAQGFASNHGSIIDQRNSTEGLRGFQESNTGSMLQSIHQGLATGKSSILAGSHLPQSSLLVGASMLAPPPNLRQDLKRLGLEYTAADMSLSALYLHEVHNRGGNSASASSMIRRPTPLISQSGVMRRTPNSGIPQRQSSLCEMREEEEGHPLVDIATLDPNV